MDNNLIPCAKWTPDCQGKWGFDGRVISISTRYWPRCGGFHTLDSATGVFAPSDNSSIKPSAKASILLNHGEPDENGYGDYTTLVEQDFEFETEAEVKAAVETWVRVKVNRIARVLEEAAKRGML
jgi:hypothetical protein